MIKYYHQLQKNLKRKVQRYFTKMTLIDNIEKIDLVVYTPAIDDDNNN